nr:hypothetical protein [Tanacetum cinerariifolium]
KQTEEGNTEPRSLENFGMITGIKIESNADSEGEVVSANDAIPDGVSVSTGNVAAAVVSPQAKTEFALMGLSTENNSGKNLYKLIDSSMSVRTKRGLGLDKYIREGELGIDDSKVRIFHTNSDELEGKPIYNRFASVYHMKAVPPPLTRNYMPPSNIPDIDESHMVYGKKATDSSEIKTNDDMWSVHDPTLVTMIPLIPFLVFLHLNAEGKGILGRRPTGKPVNPNRPKLVFAGQQNPVSAGPLNLVSAEHQNTVSAGNKDKLEDFEDFDGGEVTFRGSTGKTQGKAHLNFENVLYVEELHHFNLMSVSQICDQTHRV